MKKNAVNINEKALRKIIAESVKKVLGEEERLGVDSSRDFIYEFNNAAGKFEGELRKYLETYPDEVLSAFYGKAVLKDLNALKDSISEFRQATYEA